MAGLSGESFKFMADLWQNNNKPWFDANRPRYEEHVKLPLKGLAEDLALPVSSILPEFSGKAKVSRINNDIRFSPNKPIYKQHMWISFGGMMPCEADFFLGISGSGWSAGAGIGAPKREPLEVWRTNLIRHADKWRRYTGALEEAGGLHVFTENPYSRPLYPDAPADVLDLLQARSAWLLMNPRQDFVNDPMRECFLDLCRMLPAYLFMVVPGGELLARLGELGKSIKAPDNGVGGIWEAVLGGRD